MIHLCAWPQVLLQIFITCTVVAGFPPMGVPPGFPPGAMPYPGAMPGYPPYQQPPLAAAALKPKSDWSEHDGPTGRKYYYNSVTKVSSWTKPDELMTPEVRMKQQIPKALLTAKPQQQTVQRECDGAAAISEWDVLAFGAFYHCHTAGVLLTRCAVAY